MQKLASLINGLERNVDSLITLFFVGEADLQKVRESQMDACSPGPGRAIANFTVIVLVTCTGKGEGVPRLRVWLLPSSGESGAGRGF